MVNEQRIKDMKRTKQVMMTIVLLLWVAGAHAEKYTGTVERFGEKMKYTISGGVVTSKSGPWLPLIDCIMSPNSTAWANIGVEVQPGETISLTAERMEGTSEWYKRCEVYIGDKKAVGEGKATLSIKVPDSTQEIHAKVVYLGKNSAFEYNIFYTVKKKVNTASETYRGKTDVAMAFEDPSGYVNYTITGRNFRKYGSSDDELIADYYVGESVNITCEATTAASGEAYQTVVSYGDDRKEKLNGSVSTTYTVRNSDDHFFIGALMDGTSPHDFQTSGGVTVHVNIIDRNTSTTEPARNIKWNDVVYDNRCQCCGSDYSHFKAHGYGATYSCTGEPLNPEPDDMPGSTSYSDKMLEPGKVIYGKTRIVTDELDVGIDYGDQENAIIIEKGSIVEFTNEQGVQIWNVIKGGIRGVNLHPLKGSPGTFFYHTPHIQVIPFGTVFAIQNYGNSSRCYLLQGSAEVTSKKTNKKTTLKPGQASTVSANGEQKVQQFDIKKAAKKFGITDAQLQGQVTTATATARRYEMERAIVKYKVTRGSQQGTMAKAFDMYGEYERRELRMGNQTSIALTTSGGSYALNKNKKTAQRTQDADLNFLDFSTPLMKRLNLQKKGTAKVLNKDCTIYTGSNVEYYVWKGIVMKKVQKESNGTTVVHEVTSIEVPKSIEAKYFKMPAGYKVK